MTEPLSLETPQPEHAATIPQPLALLLERCRTLAARVADGELAFIDAIDMAYSAADWSGLVDRYGDDVVQLVLADAFIGCRR